MAVVAASFLATPAQGAEPQANVVVDPAARLLDGDGAGEAWDISARLDGGGHFLLRFWVTNEGPGSHTGLAMGWFVAPDGKVTSFRYGRERARWESAADGRFIRIASAVLDLRPPSGSVEIDTDKGGMKIYLRFAMPKSPTPICARRDGDAGFDVLRLQQDTDGIAWVAGMAAPMAANGTVDITHAWGRDSEIDALLRRIDVSGRDGDVAFFATTVTPPKDRSRATSCIAVVDSGRKIHESPSATVDVAATALAAKESSYPVPASVVFQGESATLTVKPERELLRVNPLDIVPQPFRMLLGLRSSPRRAWAESAWTLKASPAGGKAIERSGRGVTAVTYTNPW
jgi:hypothetical protein